MGLQPAVAMLRGAFWVTRPSWYSSAGFYSGN